MKLLALAACCAAAAAFSVQNVGAQSPGGSCPGGAIQSIDAAGRIIGCVPVPPPADLAPLLGADAALQAAINAEIAARIAADQALDARIGNLTRLEGRYAFTGTASCLSSSTGFRTDIELIPLITPGTVLTPSSQSVTGVRIFNGDGTGTSAATFHTITYPPVVVGQLGAGGGGATVATLLSSFTYQVMPDMTVIIDDQPADGLITKGGIRVGWKNRVVGVPRFVGHVSKDWKSVSLTHEDLAVEQSILSSPESVSPAQQFVTDRVCYRERTLYKIVD